MRPTIRKLLAHDLTGPTIRYGIAGAIVGLVYLALPLVMKDDLDWPIEVAIPIAYLIAVTLHFNLQRHFVFIHVERFALSTRQQIGRYVAIGAVQYPVTALSTAFLPGALGISQREDYVLTVITISVVSFLMLRTHVFHRHDESKVTISR